MNHVLISWTRENGRSKDLAKALGIQLVYVFPSGTLPIRYLKSSLSTWRILRSLPPGASAIFMLPPAPLAFVARFARKRDHGHNIYDLHTGFFHDPKWKWATKLCLRLMKGAIAIVTNENLAEMCRRSGLKPIVMHDVLYQREVTNDEVTANVVCPLSYSNDEPIGGILDAAAALPAITYVLTGRAPRHITDRAPKNVKFTGFLEAEAYDKLLSSAGLVVALTNRPDTMQRAGYEALIRGVPVVTSQFSVLEDFFEDSALYVSVGERDLVQKIDEGLRNRLALSTRGRLILQKRMDEQVSAIRQIRELLSV